MVYLSIKAVFLVEQFGPGPRKLPKKSKWSAYSRPLYSLFLGSFLGPGPNCSTKTTVFIESYTISLLFFLIAAYVSYEPETVHLQMEVIRQDI